MSEEKVKKVIRRRRAHDPNDPEKEKARKLRMYFNEATERAIVAYQKCENIQERNRIYTLEIYPAIEKLVENLINIHKFTSLYDTFDDLKSDCINFLFEALGKWDPNRGTAAFSYFNVVAKHCLINRVKQKNVHLRRNVSLDDTMSLSLGEHKLIEEHNALPCQDAIVEAKTAPQETISQLHEIRRQVKNENELIVINSIITLFENIEGVDLYAKSAVLFYIREMSGLTPKQLTTALQGIKRLYKKFKIDQSFLI